MLWDSSKEMRGGGSMDERSNGGSVIIEVSFGAGTSDSTNDLLLAWLLLRSDFERMCDAASSEMAAMARGINDSDGVGIPSAVFKSTKISELLFKVVRDSS